ncbi:MAG: helix-turn-helix transcriptional regulator [Rickettsiales bacterium]|nr:helix-turn-helix transcriptional regulator [Rickettsiales bacterium]
MSNHIKARRKYLKLTQQKIADAANTTKATVMKLEKGDMQLTENWMKRLSVPLQCKPEDLIASEWPAEVPIIGEVGDKSIVKFFCDLPEMGAAEPDPTYWDKMQKAPRPPEGEYREAMALRVTDDALEPLLSTGSLVYYSERLTQDFNAYIGLLVVCELSNGDVHVARLQPGYSFGNYNLLKPSGALMSDATLNWCAKIIFFKPAE